MASAVALISNIVIDWFGYLLHLVCSFGQSNKLIKGKQCVFQFFFFCWLVWFLGVSHASVSTSCLFFSPWSITIICLSRRTPSLHQPVPNNVHFVDHVNYYLCLLSPEMLFQFLCSALCWVRSFDFKLSLCHKQVAIIQTPAWVSWEQTLKINFLFIWLNSIS